MRYEAEEEDNVSEVSIPGYTNPLYLKRTLRRKLRWVMLLLCGLFVIGNNFCYDNPAVLEKELEEKMGLSSSVYGLLYTGYAIPNTILPLIGGIVMDKMGIRNGLILFTLITCAG